MRCACARLRRKAVLLLLALRADEWTIGAEGGLHRPRRLGLGQVGPPASDGGLPPEGRTGVRAAPGPDRDPDRIDSYLHLEVRFHVGDGEGGPFPVGVGNVYPPSSVRRPVRLEERPFGGFARGGLPVGCRQCTDGSKMVLFVTGICSFHCFYCPVSDEKMYKDVVFADEKRVTREADLVRLIEWAGAEGLAFVNLNEMEFSDANFPRMKVHGYETKHELSYGVKGADPVALRILERKWKTTVHYCTSGYKDGRQLRSRIHRRAQNVAHPWGIITEDETLLKGIVEGAELEPLMRDLARTYHVPADLMGVDGPRKRLEIAPWILKKLAPKLHRPAFLVEEYPTSDGLEVERTRLA